MLAAKAQEEFFAREHKYFEAEIAGNGGEVFLTFPDGARSSVRIPPRVSLSLKTRAKDKPGFVGQAFYLGGKIVHRYDSETGRMSSSVRERDGAG
jgi:hypothetical protein